MDPERYQRLKDLTQRAFALPREERQEFLERECGEDEKLLRGVGRLLAHDETGADEITVAALLGSHGLAGTTSDFPIE